MGDQLRTKQGRRTEFVGTIAGKSRNLHQESCRFRLAEVFADHSLHSGLDDFQIVFRYALWQKMVLSFVAYMPIAAIKAYLRATNKGMRDIKLRI